jgi:signal transduction histidine kinase
MNRFQIRGLQWGAGAFLVVLGALLLIAPHQFSFLESSEYSRLAYYGLPALFLGGGLISLSVSNQPRGLSLLLQLAAGGLLLWLAYVLYANRSQITALNYAVLGAGLVVFGLARFLFRKQAAAPRTSSLGMILAVGSILTGWLIRFYPARLASTPIFHLTEPSLLVFGSLLLGGGLWLMLANLHLAFETRLKSRLWRYFDRGAFIFCGVVFLVFWAYNGLGPRVWVGATFFGVFGLLLIFFPLTGPSPFPFEPTSLRTRLALILALATSFPLILTIAYISNNEETEVRQEGLRRLEIRASALERNLNDYINLHNSALHTLKRHPQLMQLSGGEQAAVLSNYHEAYPDAVSFSLYDAAGELAASSGAGEIGPSIAGRSSFEAMQRSGEGFTSSLVSPVTGEPIISFIQPVQDPAGEFAGAVTFSLTPTRILEQISSQGSGDAGQIYLVDQTGRVIAHPDRAVATITTDLSAVEPVQTLIRQERSLGSFPYQRAGAEMLVAYAQSPGPGWWLIFEQPTASIFARIYETRDRIFGLLLVFLGAAVLGGYYLAGQLIFPLQRLLHAVTGLAVEDMSVPLPTTEISEIQLLIQAFSRLRNRLVRRTAEREQAIAALQAAKAELEDRVEQRTQEIQAYASRLEQSNQELEDFAFIASHDMQEPLRKIQIFGDLLQKRYGNVLAGEGQDYIQRMQSAAGRMRQMIDALLDYSRVSTKTRPFEPVNLNAVIVEVIDDLEASIQRNRGQIYVETLPVISADPMQIRQLFQNLISNALKFHRDDSGPVIKITCRQAAPGRIELLVSDNGIGIDMDKADYLFQLFHRLHGRREFEGAGMGLAICRKIAERHGGSIRVESTPGAGATFIVNLPA